jgi:succinate dehydrogenase / fumarate reductase iron-sulfur subunit
MEAIIRVRRFNPEAREPGPYWQEYRVEVERDFTILDTLLKIRNEVDASLALRYSCRSNICGSCAMRINRRARLACKTKVVDLAPRGEAITIEPMGNMSPIKDLVVDLTSFWEKVRAVRAWLLPSSLPEQEFLVPNEDMLHLTGVMNCILCGACVSDCTVLEVDPNFLGPAALAKAYRFVADPRDGASGERLQALSQYSGIWDCTRCLMCVEVCPKYVAPLERIITLRRKAIERGLTEVLGARHTLEFEERVRQRSWLQE